MISISLIPVCVAIGCWLVMNIPIAKSTIIGAIFFVYKLVLTGILIGIGMMAEAG